MVRFLKKLDEDRLKTFALMFMEDCYQVCNVSLYHARLEPSQTQFNLSLRQFRHQHPWLAQNMLETDTFDKLSEEERIIVYGLRHNPQNPEEQIAMVANFEGEPITLNIKDLLPINPQEWEIAIACPGLAVDLKLEDLDALTLSNSQGILLKRVN